MIISIDTGVAGSTATQLSANPSFELVKDGFGLFNPNVAVLDSTVTVGYDLVPEDVRPAIPGGYIQTINEVPPNSNGEFFIDGSGCVSWAYVNGGTVSELDTNNTVDDPTPGIAIVDLCPSCTTCEAVYRLKYEVENLKMWINTLKDINLYDNTTKNDRINTLEQLRITGGSTSLQALCGQGVEMDSGYKELKALRLIPQYITLVHMWNYIVSQNNSSTEILLAPDDNCGFVVQSKRALPSCDDNQTIQCQIDVSCASVIKDDGTVVPYSTTWGSDPANKQLLSVYIPRHEDEDPVVADGVSKCVPLAKMSFEPFTESDYATPYLTEADQQLTCLTPVVSPDHKIVASNVIQSRAAGTYVIQVKFLPFVNTVITGPNGEVVTIRNGSLVYGNVTPSGTGDDKVYNFTVTSSTPTKVPSPTRQEYLDAKTAPTRAVPWMLVWNIEITWIIDPKDPADPDRRDVSKETHLYKCNGVRVYYDGVFMSDTMPDVFDRSTT